MAYPVPLGIGHLVEHDLGDRGVLWSGHEGNHGLLGVFPPHFREPGLRLGIILALRLGHHQGNFFLDELRGLGQEKKKGIRRDGIRKQVEWNRVEKGRTSVVR